MPTMIRTTDESDFGVVFQLLQQLWPDIKLNQLGLKTTLLNTINSPTDLALCAWRDNKVVGFIAGSKVIDYWHAGYICHVSTLVVDVEHRGNSVGTDLLDAAKKWAYEENCQAIELDSAFYREKAHAFYDKNGFEKRAFTFSLDLTNCIE